MNLSDDQEIKSVVRRSSDDFSFLDSLGDFTINGEFKRGYVEYKSGRRTEKSFIWQALSVIGEDVGNVIYNGVAKYVDNVCNIDLCRLDALKSVMEEFGIEYSILNEINMIPLDFRNLMDTLSINKKYLFDSGIINKGLIDVLSVDTYQCGEIDLSGISSVSEVRGYIDEDKYRKFIYDTYYNFILGKFSQKYCIEDQYPIYSTYGYQLEKKFNNSSILDDEIYQLKIRNSVRSDFDEESIVDDIELGDDTIDNYTGTELEILQIEIKKRQNLKYPDFPDSKYSYYREREVREYYNFLKNKFYGSHAKELSVYDFDNRYFEVDQEDVVYMLSSDSQGRYQITTPQMLSAEGKVSFMDVLSNDVMELTDMTIYLAKLREEVKLQSQKRYMKGTFTYLSYVINEYLRGFGEASRDLEGYDSIRNNLKDHVVSDVKITEYYDTTEYFNLSTQTTPQSRNKKMVNDRFWENDDSIQNSNSGFSFAKDEIENFYCNVLKTCDDEGDLMQFLSTVYSSGANRSYVDQTSGELNVNSTTSLSSESAERFQRSFGVKDFGSMPYYNHKNVTHTSYQIHPYLYDFIDAAGYSFPIENAFYNEIVDDLEDSEVVEYLKGHIGEYGQVINVALYNQYDFSGYKTKYENSTHESKFTSRGQKTAIIDYDGAFYPKAVKQFLNDREEFILQLRNMHGEYYKEFYYHLNLSQKQANHIADQLELYYSDIMEKAETKSSESEVWDIFRYVNDQYDNAYILYKKYGSGCGGFADKANTRGELWIRLKDHPIAFPAFKGTNPQIDTRVDYYNNLLDSIIDGGIGHTQGQCDYFYDMDIDDSKQFMFVSYYPKNVPKMKDVIGQHPYFYDNVEYSSTIAFKVDMDYVRDFGYTTLRLNSNREDSSKIDGYINEQIPSEENPYGYTFAGFRVDNTNTYLVYLKKFVDFSITDPQVSLKNSQIIVKLVLFKKMKEICEFSEMGVVIPETYLKKFKLNSPKIIFGSYSDKLVFATTAILREECEFESYLGYDKSNYGKTTYVTASEGYGIKDGSIEMNSLDVFSEMICYIETSFGGGKMTVERIKLYNTIADPSYIPQFAGLSGQTDIQLSPYYAQVYDDNKYLNYELLGWSNNIDSYIDMVNTNVDIDVDVEEIRSLLNGRVWQEFGELDDRTLDVIINKTLKSESGEQFVTWEISSIQDTETYLDKHLSAMQIAIYNYGTYGKNPYYVGSLEQISTDSEDKYIHLNYTFNIKDSEASVGTDVKIAGTYNVYLSSMNMSESNNIDGITDMKINFHDRKLKIVFEKDDPSESMFIPYRTMAVAILNTHDIRMFEKNHFLDQYGIIHGIIDRQNGHDHRKYKDIFLSSEHLSSYDSISQIPYLSGFSNNLQFKINEHGTYPLSSLLYFNPGYNDTTPPRMVDMFQFGFANDKYDVSKLFSEKNLYVIKCEDESIFKNIGVVQIPIAFSDSSALRIDERYLHTSKKEFDVVDSQIMSYIRIHDNHTKESCVSSIDLPETCDYNSFVVMLSDYCYPNGIIPHRNEDGDTAASECLSFDFGAMESIPEQLKKFLNIYVHYTKNDNGGINLYFNYINYLNTPFVTMTNGRTKVDFLDGTYLKLKPGEDGTLRIIVQIKYYFSEHQLYGFKNINVVNYQIYNISDDKPKFLIAKTSQV